MQEESLNNVDMSNSEEKVRDDDLNAILSI